MCAYSERTRHIKRFKLSSGVLACMGAHNRQYFSTWRVTPRPQELTLRGPWLRKKVLQDTAFVFKWRNCTFFVLVVWEFVQEHPPDPPLNGQIKNLKTKRNEEYRARVHLVAGNKSSTHHRTRYIHEAKYWVKKAGITRDIRCAAQESISNALRLAFFICLCCYYCSSCYRFCFCDFR